MELISFGIEPVLLAISSLDSTGNVTINGVDWDYAINEAIEAAIQKEDLETEGVQLAFSQIGNFFACPDAQVVIAGRGHGAWKIKGTLKGIALKKDDLDEGDEGDEGVVLRLRDISILFVLPTASLLSLSNFE